MEAVGLYSPLESSRSCDQNEVVVHDSLVEVNYRGLGKFYPGRVERVWADEKFDIIFDGGQRETRVDRSLIKLSRFVPSIDFEILSTLCYQPGNIRHEISGCWSRGRGEI